LLDFSFNNLFYETFPDYPPTRAFQHVYDICLVWSPEIQGDEMERKPVAGLDNSDQLGNSLVRIHPASPCQPDWFQILWRAVFFGGVKSDSRGNHAFSICGIFCIIFQERDAEMEPLCWIRFTNIGGVFHFQKIR